MYSVKGYVKQGTNHYYTYIDECEASIRYHNIGRYTDGKVHFAYTNCKETAVLVVDDRKFCLLHAKAKQEELNFKELLEASEQEKKRELDAPDMSEVLGEGPSGENPGQS